ncbi:MAG: 3-deoxy-manno-octulosonate cytidylyltransferase (CMP-KDO synthetase) [Halieaceae bacterium]|jgi:3-deoxy-manno-octulosonate cytidylyltransferase (CMP-KDO synthetase)
MSFSIIIPARYDSSRLPGKPLADICGIPMIQHVYQRALASEASRVIVATDDQRIVDAVAVFAGEVVKTRSDHLSGTDRIHEVAAGLGLGAEGIVVNVQGDEPLLPPSVINQVAANLEARSSAGMATLCTQINDIEEVLDPNAVKVVMAGDGRAMYFSRAPIPWHRDSFATETPVLPPKACYYRHLGIYAFRVGTLAEFTTWPQSEAEQAESLEQLRALEHGVFIHCEQACEAVPAGIDTAEDLEKVRNLLMESSDRI